MLRAEGIREEFDPGSNPAQFLATFSRDYGGGRKNMFPSDHGL
ncbi:hypothetical protein COO91_09616 (plasmid) [Nostoc flagelliforme CCNUN1]|uniref:Uncharacterized protein n=1 Tax=Nostoc flagelliforme CCNUN1 TaxID=2038116 RepID=A0A2K8T6W3_9NOSO|nr:hypothetical protein COO91_09616 [Nostoc flagelliforme CCNUN1]